MLNHHHHHHDDDDDDAKYMLTFGKNMKRVMKLNGCKMLNCKLVFPLLILKVNYVVLQKIEGRENKNKNH